MNPMLAVALLAIAAIGCVWLWTSQRKAIAAAASKMPLTIELHEDGLTVHREDSTTTRMRWHDIFAIRAFKRDHYSHDTIYFAVDCTLAGGGFQISEDHDQFRELVGAFAAHLSGFDHGWFERVAVPAFAANETWLYWRRPVQDDEP